MCTKYRPIKPQSDHIKEEKDSYVGKIVVDKAHGIGMIIEKNVCKDKNVYVVKYVKGKVIRKYFSKEIKEILYK
jgi:hypothetical protein